MNSTWWKVWDGRKLPVDRPIGLESLLELDGFDTETGRVGAADWRAYCRAVIEMLGIDSGDSVHEIGCGAGAFLLALRELRDLELAGSDYASGQVDVASVAIPDGDFSVAEAAELPEAPTYDFVIANSAFQYFPDLDYAACVLERMVAKARQRVAILDVPDLRRREAAEQLRRDKLTPERYEEMYAGLEHRYYSPEWFSETAARNDMVLRVSPSLIPNYAQAEYRFNIVLERRLDD